MSISSFSNVDMLAEARDAQWSAATFLGENAIKLLAPAKVNLFLGIGGRQPDGYHNVTNVMHALAMHDILFMNVLEPDECDASDAEHDDPNIAFAGPNANICVKIDTADKTAIAGTHEKALAPLEVNAKDNLVFKAVDALAQAVNHAETEQMLVRVEKHVPHQAGLGGGSADAAAALVGAAHFWGIESDDPVLHEVAALIGADVAFFLKGRCALLTGKGEHLEREIAPMKNPVVIVKPAEGVSTAAAYAAFDEAPVTVPEELLAAVDKATEASEIPLYNNLTAPAETVTPAVAEVIEWLRGQEGVAKDANGEPKVLLSGSGSAVFAITDSYDDGLRISSNALAKCWWSRATSFSSLRALKV